MRIVAECSVKNNSNVSSSIIRSNEQTIKHGVKQGGVFSPYTICHYTDNRLKIIEESGVEFHMSGHFC